MREVTHTEEVGEPSYGYHWLIPHIDATAVQPRVQHPRRPPRRRAANQLRVQATSGKTRGGGAHGAATKALAKGRQLEAANERLEKR